MNNNYEYVQKLKQNLEEQEKIKEELKKELDFLLIPTNEKENLITNILNTALETYSPTTILNFNKFVKTRLIKEVDKLYFKPSSIIPIEEQKIIYLYLTQENNHFLTEEEIRKRLHTNSGNIYNVLNKLKTNEQKTSEELKKIFPDYKKQLIKRKKEQQPSSPLLSETDLRILGYYIGEINDICLGIDEIARKEGKKESEIEKNLNFTFHLLKEKKENIALIKAKYPNCEKMLQLKATNFGIKLSLVKEDSPTLKPKQPKSKKEEKTLKPQKEIPILSKNQEKLLTELAKNPNIEKEELLKYTNYKNKNSMLNTLRNLKKKCKTNKEVKARVLELYPNFLTSTSKTLLTKKQERLLKELAKNPNITKKELAEIMGYKNPKTLYQAIFILKKKCETNEELKEKVLELYPNFLDSKPKQKRKKQQTLKQERPLLTKKQEIILKELAKNPAIPKKELAKLTEYKNAHSLRQAIAMLKKKCETNEEVKAKSLELYPNFLDSKPKQKQQKSLLTKKQEILLKELAQNPNISGKELVKLTGYKNKNTLWTTLNILKNKCKTNKEVKEKVLELYPDFLNPKPKPKKKKTQKQKKSSLTKKQEILLKELAQNPNISGKELVKLAGYKNENSIWSTLSILKKKCETDEELKAKVLKLHPDFLNPKPKQKQTKKSVLTNQELQILQNIYLITPPKTSYITYEQLSSELNYCESQIHHIKKKALEKIESNPKAKEELQEIWPSFEQDKIIREHYKKGRSIKIPSQELEKIKSCIRQYDIPENNIQEEKRNNILTGIHNLENSIFSPYVSKCTEEQKAMLALRLGFINAPATTEIVAELFGVEQQEVITLTKNCLQSAKPTLTAKTYQKKKEN